MKMKFGIFNIGDYHPQANKTLVDYYDQMLEQVEWAEQLGYDSFWFGEHHFDFFGVVPAPPVMMAAAAKRTKKIRIGVAVALLPYRNPILTAEEYAMVDILSRGRLDFGVGRGTPLELKGFGVTEDNRDILVEALEIVKMAWREGRIEFHGKYYNIPGVNVNVVPVQKPLPPLYFAALSAGSYEVAGEKGYPILGIPYARCQDMADVKQKVMSYKERLAAHGHDPKKIDVVQCFHTHVAATEKEADINGRAGLVPYLTARISIRPRDYDELYRQRMIIVGDPNHCVEHIEEVRTTGTNYIIFLMNFATLEQEKILASMEIMAKEVLPKFK
ncbi:MAG TPA: LLM class flavin-dependent oxidoreductase [Verrucomicrobiae bacterium]|jgi:alkanesulfonate monooxygenase SsuD/methylene tetrahydromethanopterin reductase-like flavin-dependent oxidoreductase (luciferase family)|nr:LLM class flavin-dependent oxidoreductase [Verrucomicrobiae bacterium]